MVLSTSGAAFEMFGFGITYKHTLYWLDQDVVEWRYGYYYETMADSQYIPSRVNEATYQGIPNESSLVDPQSAQEAGVHQPSYDNYAVMAQGTAGTFRPVRLEERFYHPNRDNQDHGDYTPDFEWPWTTTTDPKATVRFIFDGDTALGDDKAKLDTYLPLTESSWDNWVISMGLATDKLSIKTFAGTDPVDMGWTWRFHNGGNRVVKPIIQGQVGVFLGFHIWEASGTYFAFDEPLAVWEDNTFAENMTDTTNQYWNMASSAMGPYPYAWYLKEIRYPDFLDSDNVAGPSDGDQGGWVKFSYVPGTAWYNWSTSPDGNVMDGPINRIDAYGFKKAGMMYTEQYGRKELKYPGTVETATHIAYFAISDRDDAKGAILPVDNNGNTPPNMSAGADVAATTDPNVWEVTLTADVRATYGFVGRADAASSTPYVVDYAAKGLITPIETGGSNIWTQVSHTVTGVTSCPGYDDIYTAASAPMMTFSVGGLQLKGTPIEFDSGVDAEKDGSGVGGQPICLQTPYSSLKLRVRLQDQWWGQGSAGNANAFSSLRARWNAYAATGTIAGRGGMWKLDDIYLVEKSTGTLVKQVHFSYDYSLCQGTPNSMAAAPVGSNGPGHGKLTLTAVQVFGLGGVGAPAGNSLPPYQFYYGFNPTWGTRNSYDRWGFYKSDGASWAHRDANAQDQAAWNMTRVVLPTGGSIQIQYEPKDYARVQDQIPHNPAVNNGTVANYVVDLGGSLGNSAWPKSEGEMDAFSRTMGSKTLRVISPMGDKAAGVSPVRSSAPQRFVPIESAPDPKDYRANLATYSSKYRDLSRKASELLGGSPKLGSLAQPGPEGAGEHALLPDVAGSRPAAHPVERMVTLLFEYWTAGDRPNRAGLHPFTRLTAEEVKDRNFTDRGAVLKRNALARMRSRQDGGADLVIVDPEFRWPTAKPNAMYMTYPSGTTTPAPKVGGGARVRRVISSDGHRSFLTSYTYTDLVNGAWTSSGVAGQEPSPSCLSADDDRIFQPEYDGLWANEGGGIVHSRVVVRHAFTDDPVPAGVTKADGTVASTPMGETIFRFLTSADLPHRVKKLEYNKTITQTGGTNNTATYNYQQVARRYDVFNMAAWWGQLLWQETRDANGKPLGRTEHRYAEADAYLRTIYSSPTPTGVDQDVEPARLPAGNDGDPATGMTYTWADPNRPVPTLVDASGIGGTRGVSLPTGKADYLNFISDISLFRQAYTNSTNGWTQSTVNVVREYKPLPLLSETRTYSDGMKLMGVERNRKWDTRTGKVLETETRGPRTGNPTALQLKTDPFSGHESLFKRTWPAYWVYPGMDEAADGTVVNMLTQEAQVTSSRLKGDRTTEVFINSKVTPWWWPEAGQTPTSTRVGHWLNGGDFVWNGLDGTSTPKPPAFPGFTDGWTPASISSQSPETVGGYQPYKSSNWLFAGAATLHDAFGHDIEAVEGDGVFGTSKYGYPYDANGATTLKAGIVPVAKFTNAKEAETLYWSFEGPVFGSATTSTAPVGDQVNTSADPMVRLATVYSGERAKKSGFSVTPPAGNIQTMVNGTSYHELRYFVKASSQEEAHHTYATDGAKLLTDPTCEVFQAVPAEKGWWLVRAKAPSGLPRTINASPTNIVDDVSAFPWRRNGAPVSVSHFAYDRALGLVTSITGANGRTTRYKYDALGRLQTVYDAYGNPSASTRYQPQLSSAALPQ